MECQKRIAERNKGGPQFTRGAPEAPKKLPYGLSSGGASMHASRAFLVVPRSASCAFAVTNGRNVGQGRLV